PPRTWPLGSGCSSSQLSRIFPTRIMTRLWKRFLLVIGRSLNSPAISQRSVPSSGIARRSSVVISDEAVAMIELLIFDGGISDVDCSRRGRRRQRFRRPAPGGEKGHH